MWFRNLQIYRFPKYEHVSAERLEEQLARGPFVATSGTEAMSRGWVAPRNDGALVHAANGHWLLRLQTEKRLLPATVVNAEIRRQAEKLTELQGYAPGRKALRELREKVVGELLPNSHPVQSSTFVWIAPKAGWLCVDAGTPAKADAVIEHLSKCLDDFPLKPLHTQLSPQSAMADWLAADYAPFGFSIDRDCELKAVGEEKAVVSFKRHPLGDEVHNEIKAHLAAGKLPTKLALTWDDRISFVLHEKLIVKRLAFLDLLREEAEQHAETADDQFDADFAIMTGELSRFLPRLVEVLGGEVTE